MQWKNNGWWNALLRKTFDIHERADINRLPVIITQLKTVIITFDITVKVVKIQFQLACR